MDLDAVVEPHMDMWMKTREAVSQFRKLLLCSKCSSILTEPVCLGVCEHLLCKSCAGPHVGDGCSVCHSPAWVKDIHINRQLSNITELFLKLEALLSPSQSTAPVPDSSTQSNGTTVLNKKKNFKIWFSPKSRKVRCQLENPVDVVSPTGKTPTKLQASNPLSVFNFNSSSQDSGSSTPPRTGRGAEQKKKKRQKRSLESFHKRVGCVLNLPTRHQTKQTVKKKRLEAVNQQWGFGKETAVEDKAQEEQEEKQMSLNHNEARNSKRVSFQCPEDAGEALLQENNQVSNPSRGILKESETSHDQQTSFALLKEQPSATESTHFLHKQLPDHVMENTDTLEHDHSSPPTKVTKRSRSEEQANPQSTPKRPRTSPGRRRRSRPSDMPQTSKVLERVGEDHKGSPATGKNQSSPAYLKRNHRGETPLHLAAIKGDVEVAKELLEQGADPNLKDHAGWTPLHEACNLGHTGMVEVLLQQGALINTPGYENDTPLHDAVKNGHLSVVKLLLEHGASTSVLNIFGLRPIDYAATEEMREVLRLAPEVAQLVSSPINSPANQKKGVPVARRDVQTTLIGSKLTEAQQNKLIKASRALGGKRVESFSGAVTHVVVPDGLVPSTLTVLQGILNGCWIVTFKWLTECLQQGRWIEEDEFEADEGPRRARVNKHSLLPTLFDGCFFYLLGSFQNPPKEELVQLVKAGGGQLLTRQPKADSDVTQTVNMAAYHAQPDSDQAFCTHYILYEAKSSPRPGPVRLGKVWSAPSSWLVDCIMLFSLLPVPES